MKTILLQVENETQERALLDLVEKHQLVSKVLDEEDLAPTEEQWALLEKRQMEYLSDPKGNLNLMEKLQALYAERGWTF